MEVKEGRKQGRELKEKEKGSEGEKKRREDRRK